MHVSSWPCVGGRASSHHDYLWSCAFFVSKTNVCSCKVRHLARSKICKTCYFPSNALKLLWYTQPILSLGNCPKRKLFCVASQQEGPRFRGPAGAGPFCAEFECCPLTQRKGRLIGYSKLSVDVNVSVDDCSSLYLSPLMNWWNTQVCTLPSVSWGQLQPTYEPEKDKWFQIIDNMYSKISKKKDAQFHYCTIHFPVWFAHTYLIAQSSDCQNGRQIGKLHLTLIRCIMCGDKGQKTITFFVINNPAKDQMRHCCHLSNIKI